MPSRVIRNSTSHLLQRLQAVKLAESYAKKPTMPAGIKGDVNGACLTPMAAMTDNSPGPVSQTKSGGCSSHGPKKAPRGSKTSKIKMAHDPSVFAIKLAMAEIGPKSGTFPMASQREKDQTHQQLKQKFL